MQMKILIFIILCYSLENSSCYSEIGELCSIGSSAGTCKRLVDCPIATKIVSEDKEYPPQTCFYEEGKPLPVVCCPFDNYRFVHGPKEIRTVFKNNRIKKTNDMTCWYEDREPFLCCENSKYRAVPEPKSCPPLPRPKLNTPVEHPAWTKCLEYQRYINVCVADPKDTTRFIRINTCGLETATRIIDGDPANNNQFPHMATIGATAVEGSTDDADIKWLGGGTLISDKFILTAAHVIRSTRTPAPRYAFLGSLDKTNLKNGILYNIINRFPHPEYAYMADSKKHDIALVELHERVMLNEHIRPACLPMPEARLINKYVVAGWGLTEQHGNDSLTLQCTMVSENPQKCKFEEFDPEYMICAGGENTSADSCQGDSGGPLMAQFSDLSCTYSVEGIVSYGPSCRGSGVYTKVSKYMDFIMNIVWKEEWQAYKIAYLNKVNSNN